MRFSRASGLAALIAAVIAGPAEAQDRDGDGEPDGVRAGGFLVKPSLGLLEVYDSNVFIDETDPTDTFLTRVRPSVELRSNWNRHAVRVISDGDLGFFTHDSDDNFRDFGVRTNGELDITRAHRVRIGGSWRREHEERGTDDVPTAAVEPTIFDRFGGNITGDFTFGRFRFEPFAGARVLDFDDTPLIGGGIENNDDRDRLIGEAGLEIGYAVRSGYEAFVRGTWTATNFTDPIDDDGFDRDSTGTRVLGGFGVDITRLFRASVGLGFENQDFDDAALEDFSGVSVEADAQWEITRRTTIVMDVARDVGETSVSGASAVVDTGGSVGVRHSLLRNLTLDASLGYTDRAFEGIARDDELFDASAGARWRISRFVELRPEYRFRLRRSDSVGLDFDQHTVGLGVRIGY